MRKHQILAAAQLAVTSVLGYAEPSVTLSAGTVSGGKCPHSEVKLFQGIPYAQPPAGELRFLPPQPLNSSYEGGHFNATKTPPICPQFPSTFQVTGQPSSEDCLYLSVYVPAHAKAGSKLPVKVWAYGGGNDGGALSYPLYNACNLAQDAIVVAFNYRLGPLGFLGLHTAGVKGNMAIQDYLTALRWVKQNIHAFWGAGGDDTFVVSTLPEAKSLISGAILESGGGQTVTSKSLAQYAGASYAKTLNCSIHDLHCLQSKSVEELLAATQKTPALLDQNLNGHGLVSLYGFNLPNVTNLDSAILDGEIIKEEPLKVGSQVPIIAGSAELDSSLFVLPTFLESDDSITEDNYTDFLSRWGSFGPDIGKEYPLSLFNSSGSTEEAVIAAITHIATVSSFTCQACRSLQAAISVNTPAFAYRFNHTLSFPWIWIDGEAFPGKYATYFGATHASELPLVFANLDNQPWGNGTANATASERAISRTLVEAWTAMAVHGDPATKRQQWPRFTKHENKGLFVQDGFQVTEIDFSECEFWDDIWVQIGGYNVSSTSK